ncbi:uracil-DNA glycosylase [bacterium]
MRPEKTQIQSMVQQFFQQHGQIYGNEYIFSNMALKKHLWEESNTGNLQELLVQIEGCTHCALHKTRHHFVFGQGNTDANLMLIGEAPGEQEDKEGLPFVGKAGQLLDKILLSIEFDRNEVYVANILKCRPPDNRDPLPEEIEHCIPHLKKQIEMIQPKILLVLGRIAAQTLLNTTQPLNQLRGKNHRFQDIPLLVTYHPAALLRNPEWKRSTWEDVQRLRNIYDQLVGDKGLWKPAKEK